MVDRVRNTGVLRYALIAKVNLAVGIYGYVLEQGITTNRIVNIGFALLAQVNYLGIATTFVVENAIIVPAVLVVANELALGICRERCLTRARRPKKIAVSLPSWLVLAEQCIEARPLSGLR